MNDNFNLSAPPNFRGLHPDLPIHIYQRHLPHWRQVGATYFVTFRLADSIPQQQLQALKRWRAIWERNNPEPRSESQWKELAREITNQTERWLDEGYGACELEQPQIAELMRDSLLKFQDDRYFVSCFEIMPNHVHVVMKPADDHELEIILKNMKGYVSHRTNKLLGRKGTLWEQESFDRILRDEEHLYRVVQYIGRNAAMAGLPNSQWHRWLHPDWQSAGWRFAA
ncbi:transposase [Novipirellula caenicola]|uniref:Transposase IS200-like domain-containing protein n=1 Tax=Novipirellula caenicola TaxID=1536901 RepID=A0ABP9VQI5_9BACT